jgi:hypothetical protein
VSRAKKPREVIECPYAKSDMTPCVARDGQMCVAGNGVCVGCGNSPADMLRDLVLKYVNLSEAHAERGEAPK